MRLLCRLRITSSAEPSTNPVSIFHFALNFHCWIISALCTQESKVKFHVLGLKCQHCNSYNTSQEKEEGLERLHAEAAAQNDDAGEDEWTTEDEEEIVGGEVDDDANGAAAGAEQSAEPAQQASGDDELADALDLGQVQLYDVTNEGNDLPIDWKLTLVVIRMSIAAAALLPPVPPTLRGRLSTMTAVIWPNDWGFGSWYKKGKGR